MKQHVEMCLYTSVQVNNFEKETKQFSIQRKDIQINNGKKKTIVSP